MSTVIALLWKIFNLKKYFYLCGHSNFHFIFTDFKSVIKFIFPLNQDYYSFMCFFLVKLVSIFIISIFTKFLFFVNSAGEIAIDFHNYFSLLEKYIVDFKLFLGSLPDQTLLLQSNEIEYANDNVLIEKGSDLVYEANIFWQLGWPTVLSILVFLALFIGVTYYIYKTQLNYKLNQREAQRLIELDNFRSTLFTNITHEFRTPLTIILGMAKQIRQNPEEYLEQGSYLIESNGENLLRLVNQLLDLSKMENNSFQIHLIQDDIMAYLRYLTESFFNYANINNLSLSYRSNVDTLMVDFDPEQIKHIITNLLSNAIKFTLSGGQIELRTEVSGNLLIIYVQDSGIGISEKDLPLIFKRFYQVDGSSTRAGQGTGIGLAHTQEIVKLLNGKISVDSEIGKGTTFKIELPIERKAKVTRITENLHPKIDKVNKIKENNLIRSGTISNVIVEENEERPVILLVEDNHDIVTYLKSCLKETYETIVAYNGKIGVEKAIETIPDIVISDIMMPEKDGFEVCNELKQDERTSHIPIILLTAKADHQSKIAGLKRGADVFLTKPFDPEELLVQIRMLLKKQRTLQAFFQNEKNQGNIHKVLDKSVVEAIAVEDLFLQKVNKIIESNFEDEDFALPQLCQKLGMSRSQLFRKIKALTHRGPSDHIRIYRLQKAREMLKSGIFNVSEVAWKTGFKDHSYFSKLYKEEFGEYPSATIK